jgi:hypothetical protein
MREETLHWVESPVFECFLERGEGDGHSMKMRRGGIHPHCDRKSPQAIERKRVVGRPLRKRVRKPLEVKELNELDELKDDARAWFLRGVTGQTRERIAENALRVNYFIGTVRTICGKAFERERRNFPPFLPERVGHAESSCRVKPAPPTQLSTIAATRF